jgi:hypothetical protein
VTVMLSVAAQGSNIRVSGGYLGMGIALHHTVASKATEDISSCNWYHLY